jgi:hypothetical protein
MSDLGGFMQQVYTYTLGWAADAEDMGLIAPEQINTLEPVQVGDLVDLEDGAMVGRVVARKFVPRSLGPTDEADCLLLIEFESEGETGEEDPIPPQDLWTFGDALSNTMRKFGLRNKDIVEMTGINPAQISEFTKGEYKLSVRNLECLIRHLEPEARCHLLSLVGGWGKPHGHPSPTD